MSETRGRRAFVTENFNKFMNSNKNFHKLSANEAFDLYCNWAIKNNNKIMSEASFYKKFKDFAPGANKTIVRSTKMSLVEQFDTLEQYVRIMTDGVINSLFVYGAPGVGKTETIKRALIKYGADFKYVQGSIKDSYSAAKILYENRKNKIIVFDDFDALFKIKGAIDLLKVALQDHYSRIITWADGTKRSKKDTIPQEFEFTSSVIVISNKPKIDPALKDRSMIVNINADKIEILEWIHLHFDTFLPDMPIEFKNTVYEFMKANIGKFKTISYRVFKKAICDFLVCKGRGLEENYWKKIVLQNADF